MSAEIAPDLLRRLLDYSRASGKLFWRERTPDMYEDEKANPRYWCRRWNATCVGKEAFTEVMPGGFRVGRILDRSLLAHCVVWAHQHQEWPAMEPEHIDGDPGNNRVENLHVPVLAERVAPVRMFEPSGHKGVLWHGPTEQWLARIKDQWGVRHVGLFDTPEQAVAARTAALWDHQDRAKEV